ncbi:MAG TPA: PIG-L family deacetylase [bacterium]|nr:PIG-L family deacetylase [bacterium]
MRILAVGAHPDDIEFHCGGTLAKYSKDGNEIFMAYLCSGCYGSKDTSPEELAKIRAREARNSAGLIGAKVFGPIADDLGLYPTREMRIKVVDIIRQAKPDLIFTHSTNDYMPDHVTTGQLVFDAAFTATLPLFKTDFPAHEKIMPIYSMDTAAGICFEPDVYIDITGFFETKKKMLLSHESQYKWIENHHQANPVKFIEKVSGFRGLQCGVEYAEAFKKVKVWGRVFPENLMP